ncbi:MAG: hypothetical protein CL946_07455 [Ectothiorhodospiraceae bacterium]|nr:hypothetical protein [Ectothiorhodospiraceae bacterium]
MIGAFHANSIYLIEAGTFESTEEHFPRYFVNLKVVLDSGGTTGFAVGILDLPVSHLHRDDRLRALYFVFTFHGSLITLNVSGALLPSFERRGILGGVGASLGVMITPMEKLSIIGELSLYLSDTSFYARSGQGGWFYGIRYAVFESLAVQLAGVSGTVDNRDGPSFIGGVHYTVFSQ